MTNQNMNNQNITLLTEILRGNLEEVKTLIANGVDMNVMDKDWGWVPLHCAIREGYVEIAKFLIERGAILN